MDWTTPVDIYCERLGPGLWAEPINALSNLAFPIAALWGWRAAHLRGRMTPVLAALLVLAALIGVGSFLFHTFANSWSELADVVPIWTFVAAYVLTAIHVVGGVAPGRLVRIAAITTAIATVIFLATGSDTTAPANAPGLLNGSGQYAPALIALLVFTLLTQMRRHPTRHWVAGATATFALSLLFRTLDMHLCATLRLGTHFLWHLLNGLMVGLLLQALIRAPKSRQAPR